MQRSPSDLLPRESRTVQIVPVKPGGDMPAAQPTVRLLFQMLGGTI